MIKFGTDGFRGVIAEDFTFKNVELIARALAVYLSENFTKKEITAGVLVGYDRRFASDKFAKHFARTLSQNNIPVFLTHMCVPTPAISWAVRKMRLVSGVIITASHNPPIFNGVKIKNRFGASVTGEVTSQIERLISRPKKITRPRIAKIKTVNVTADYIKALRGYLDLKILRKSRFKIIVDAMHGVTAGITEQAIKDTPFKITTINVGHDPFFGGINPEPIEKNLTALKRELQTGRYDLGLAFDGDGDRIGAMCPNGEFINSHQAICLILLHLIENRCWRGKVVKTINTTNQVDKITKHYKLPLEIVPVGFKNIAAQMIKNDVLLGGEESGGIGFKNYMPERDGILSGLLLLELMACRKMSIAAIIKDMEKRFGCFRYMRRDLGVKKIKSAKPIKNFKQICGEKVVKIEDYDGKKFNLEDDSWLLIRASGTEPIVRIYAEAHTLTQTRRLIRFGAGLL